jgi:KaiC/GvpD/RAD55 family RecA-like ATPase
MAKTDAKSKGKTKSKNIFDILLNKDSVKANKRKKATKKEANERKEGNDSEKIKTITTKTLEKNANVQKKTKIKQKTEKEKKEKKPEKRKEEKEKTQSLKNEKRGKRRKNMHKETIEQILKGIKEIEYESKRRKIIEAEPHIEHILTPEKESKKEEKEEPSTQLVSIMSNRKMKKEIEKVSFAKIQPEKKEIETIKTVATIQKERKSFEKPSLIKTGIPGFDEMCGGGIEEKSIVLINGDAGSGKTIFGLQFLYEGAKNGEAGLYISFGEPRETLYPRMLNFGMNFQQLEEKQLFFMLEYQPHEIAKIMQEEGGTLYDLITAYNIKRVVVDPITPYLMQFNDPYRARLALVRLFSVFRKFQVTTMLLNEWSSQLPTHPSTAVAEFLADGIVYLIHRRSPEGVQIRGIEIWKMTGVGHTEVARPFAFTQKGIVIYPNERLFFGGKETK